MSRYFLGIPVSDETADRLLAAQPLAWPNLRIVARSELHLTLHFLGELSEQHVELAVHLLASVQMERFEITIRGVGQFPPESEA